MCPVVLSWQRAVGLSPGPEMPVARYNLRTQCTMGICAASFEKFKVEARSEVSASKLRQN